MSVKVPNSGPRTGAVVLIAPVRAVAVAVASPAGQDAVSVFTLKRLRSTLPPCRNTTVPETRTPVKGRFDRLEEDRTYADSWLRRRRRGSRCHRRISTGQGCSPHRCTGTPRFHSSVLRMQLVQTGVNGQHVNHVMV